MTNERINQSKNKFEQNYPLDAKNTIALQNLSSTADKATLASKLKAAVENDLFGNGKDSNGKS